MLYMTLLAGKENLSFIYQEEPDITVSSSVV